VIKRYLVTCSCGNAIPVEPRQAGEKVPCPCGLTVDIPTLMALRRLPVAQGRGSRASADEKVDRAAQAISARAIPIFIGLGMFTVALIVAAVMLLFFWPTHPVDMLTEARFARNIEHFSPSELVLRFDALKANGPEGFAIHPQEMAAYHKYFVHFVRWLCIDGALAVVGVLIALGGLIFGGGPADLDREFSDEPS